MLCLENNWQLNFTKWLKKKKSYTNEHSHTQTHKNYTQEAGVCSMADCADTEKLDQACSLHIDNATT